MSRSPDRNGWPTEVGLVTIDGPALSIAIAPLRGGKIVSIRDTTGREWLAPPVHVPVAPPRPGSDFLAADMAGWDECAPSIVTCTVDGVEIRDHGNLWTTDAALSGPTVTIVDDATATVFRRTITMTSTGATFEYSVTGGRVEVPYLWAAHPQFSAFPGTRVVLPSSVSTVVDVLDDALPELPWNADVDGLDAVPANGYRKVYVHPDERADSARLVHADGSWLELRWTGPCDYLGLWFDNAALRDRPIIAIEPATGYFDSLATAVRLGRTMTVPPGSTVSWTVALTIGR